MREFPASPVPGPGSRPDDSGSFGARGVSIGGGSPRAATAGVRSLLVGLRESSSLVGELVTRDLRARYAGSAMGFFWSVLYPALSLGLYFFVFRMVLRVRWEPEGDAGTTVLYMLAGIVVWTAFAETLSRATNCLVEHKHLIGKVRFPSEVLAPSLALSALVNMAIGVVVVGIARVSIGTASDASSWAALAFLPLLVIVQLLFTVGLGYALATANLYFRDVFHLVGVLVTVWMFATPIFYPAELAREAGFGWLLAANPMHGLIESYRDVLVRGVGPRAWDLLWPAAAALLAFGFGAKLFAAHRPYQPDLV